LIVVFVDDDGNHLLTSPCLTFDITTASKQAGRQQQKPKQATAKWGEKFIGF